MGYTRGLCALCVLSCLQKPCTSACLLAPQVVFRARIKRPEGLPAQRTKWWVPPGGPTNSDMLAVLIPVPGGDLVWQCHAPLRVMQEKGLGFDAVKGEAVSSHADNTSSGAGGSGGKGSGKGSGGRQGVKERCLKAFETFPPEFTDVVKATPPEVGGLDAA